LESLAGKLASAQAELKPALAAFAISYNALFLMLQTFLVRDASSRIAAILHPSVRAISDASIKEVAGLATEVIDLQPLAIRVEPGVTMLNSTLPPENIEREAERALPKAEPLLLEAAKHLENGFQPPAAFNLEICRESKSCRCGRSLKPPPAFSVRMEATRQLLAGHQFGVICEKKVVTSGPELFPRGVPKTMAWSMATFLWYRRAENWVHSQLASLLPPGGRRVSQGAPFFFPDAPKVYALFFACEQNGKMGRCGGFSAH
jgi:hypothetical protein